MKDEVLPLTGIRGVAALWVVVLHVVGNFSSHGFLGVRPAPIENALVFGGSLAVDIFFVLSGYILTMTYGTRSRIDDFFVHRIARIFPLHLIILTGMAIGVSLLKFAGFHFSADDSTYFNFVDLPYHATLVFVWIGMPLAWNGPAWSLSVELFAYLLFPFLRAAIGRSSASRPYWVSAAIGLVEMGFIWKAGLPVTGVLALLRGVLGFSLGISLRLLPTLDQLSSKLAGFTALSALVLIAAGFPALAVLPLTGLVYALGQPVKGLCRRLLSRDLFVWLGHISYSIYLLHAPLLIAYLIPIKLFNSLHQGLGLLLCTVAYFGCLLGLSTLTYRWIETPSRMALRAAWLRRKGSAGSPDYCRP